MLQTYYSYLRDRIINDEELILQKISADWFLNQYYPTRSQEDAGLITSTPIVFIEFMPITWFTLPDSIQRAILTFRLHIITESVFVDDRNFILPETPNVTNNKHLVIRERIFKIMMNKRVKLSDIPDYLGGTYKINDQDAVIMESMVRTTSQVTTQQMNNLVLSIEEYRCLITDYSASPRYLLTTPPTALQIDCEVIPPAPVEQTFEVNITAELNTLCGGGLTALHGEVIGGHGPITYQWQKYIDDLWTDIEGATEADYDTPVLTGEGEHIFRLNTTRGLSTHSSESTSIIIQDPPDVYISPDDLTFPPGSSTTIHSEVIGGIGGNNYQWQEYQGEDNWSDIPDATSAEYLVLGFFWGQGTHTFRLHVTQEAGCEGYSDPVELIISV